MVRVRNHLRCHAARACNDSSIAMSGVSERSRNGYLSEYLCASQRAARSGVLAASALSKRRHVPPRLPHEPYGRPLSRCEALRQKAARLRGTYCKRTLAPRNTQQKRVTSCGVRRARCTNAASRTRPRWPRSERRKWRKPHARHCGRHSRPAAAVNSARQAWAGRRRAGALQRRRGSAASSCPGRTSTGTYSVFVSVTERRRRPRAAGGPTSTRCASPEPREAHGGEPLLSVLGRRRTLVCWPPRRKTLRSQHACEALRARQECVAQHTDRLTRCAVPLSRGRWLPGALAAQPKTGRAAAQTAAARAGGAGVRPGVASALCVALGCLSRATPCL